MSALHFRFERAPFRRNVVLRVLLGLLGVSVLAVLVFFSVFVGAAMIAIGLAARLLKQRAPAPRTKSRNVLDAEYRVVS